MRPIATDIAWYVCVFVCLLDATVSHYVQLIHRYDNNTVLCYLISYCSLLEGGSVAEWLACWTQVQKARVQIAVATLSGNSLRQSVHTHCASVHQAAKLVAAPLRVARVTAGLTESNGSLPPGL